MSSSRNDLQHLIIFRFEALSSIYAQLEILAILIKSTEKRACYYAHFITINFIRINYAPLNLRKTSRFGFVVLAFEFRSPEAFPF